MGWGLRVVLESGGRREEKRVGRHQGLSDLIRWVRNEYKRIIAYSLDI